MTTTTLANKCSNYLNQDLQEDLIFRMTLSFSYKVVETTALFSYQRRSSDSGGKGFLFMAGADLRSDLD